MAPIRSGNSVIFVAPLSELGWETESIFKKHILPPVNVGHAGGGGLHFTGVLTVCVTQVNVGKLTCQQTEWGCRRSGCGGETL